MTGDEQQPPRERTVRAITCSRCGWYPVVEHAVPEACPDCGATSSETVRWWNSIGESIRGQARAAEVEQLREQLRASIAGELRMQAVVDERERALEAERREVARLRAELDQLRGQREE